MLQIYSEERRHELLDVFNKESLFGCLFDVFNDIDDHVSKLTTMVENWEDAKNFVQKVLSYESPLLHLTLCIKELRKGYDDLSPVDRDHRPIDAEDFFCTIDPETETDVILLYSYAIFYFLSKTRKVSSRLYLQLVAAISKEKGLNKYLFNDERKQIIQKCIDEGIADGMTYDYDYVHNRPLETIEERVRAEEEAQELVRQTDKLAKIPVPSESDNVENAEDDDPASDLPNRLKVAYVLQLLNITSKEQIKNERALCRVLKILVGASRTSVQRYLETFTLDVVRNKDEIKDFNEDLKESGLPLLTTHLDCE